MAGLRLRCRRLLLCYDLHEKPDTFYNYAQPRLLYWRISSLGVCDTPLRSPSNTVGAMVRGYKSAVSKQIGHSVWQRNFYEHIIRNEKSHQHIANIINNHTNWKDDKFYTVDYQREN